jgi:hypothetical protein
MPLVACTYCRKVVARYLLPHHIREEHLPVARGLQGSHARNSVECMQCHKVVARWELSHHIRKEHLLSTRGFQASHARNYHDAPNPPTASPRSSTGELTSAPSESSNTLSTESDLTLSTATTTRSSTWQQQNSVQPPAPTTIDDIALSRNHLTDLSQTFTQHIHNSVRFQVQDLVDEFEGLEAAVRQACIKEIWRMPIFPVSVIFVTNLRGGSDGVYG